MSVPRILKNEAAKSAPVKAEETTFPVKLTPADWKRLHSTPYLALFQTYSGAAISFFLDFKDDKTNYVKLIERCGGTLVERPDHPRTMILVDHDKDSKHLETPLFKMTYVIDCVNFGRIMNPNNYLFNKTERYAKVKFLDLFYFDKGSENCDESQKNVPDNSVSTPAASGSTVSGCESPSQEPPKSENDVFKVPLPPKVIKKPSKLKYSMAEMKAIISYITQTKGGFQRVKGKSFWREMEMKGVCRLRPFESLRNQFFKYILPKIETFTHLDRKHMLKFLALKKGPVVRSHLVLPRTRPSQLTSAALPSSS